MAKLKIKVDYSKCTDPKMCRICVGQCPPGVFNLLFYDKDYHDPKDWRILAVFPKNCLNYKNNGKCDKCVKECPKGAISIN